MLKKLICSTHKTLSAASLVLNGYCAIKFLSSVYFNDKGFIQKQISDFNQYLPDGGLLGNICDFFRNLHWNDLDLQGTQSLETFDGLCKSGITGLLELKFSEYFFGHTTHFGIIYPALVLGYGDNWHTNGKVAIGVAAVGALEAAYWWINKNNEANILNEIYFIHDEIQELKDIIAESLSRE